MQFLRKI